MTEILGLNTANPPVLSALFQGEPAMRQVSQLCSVASGQRILSP